MPDETTMQRATALNPQEIEKALADLWKEYAAGARKGGAMGARARLANLIAYCRTTEGAEIASREITTLNNTRPVRSLMVLAEASAGTAQAAAAIRCSGTDPHPVCFEEVALHTPGETGRALPSLIEPLTVADLPTFLWFVGDAPLNDEQATRLLPFVDRVVTDSHHFLDPMARFRQLDGLIRQHRGEVVFTEMTWTRLGTWREAVGKLFDPEPSRAFLPKIRDVVITSAHGAGEPSDRALLMLGWLASRLRWKPGRLERAHDGHATTAHYDSSTGPVSVTLEEGPVTARGHLLGLEMHAGEVSFLVRRRHDDPSGAIQTFIICTGDEEPGPAYHPLHFEVWELLCNALEIRSPFTDWEEALSAVAGLEE